MDGEWKDESFFWEDGSILSPHTFTEFSYIKKNVIYSIENWLEESIGPHQM